MSLLKWLLKGPLCLSWLLSASLPPVAGGPAGGSATLKITALTSEQKPLPSHTNQGRGRAVHTKKNQKLVCFALTCTPRCRSATPLHTSEYLTHFFLPSFSFYCSVLFFCFFYNPAIQLELQLHQGLAFSFGFSGLNFVLCTPINIWEKRELNQ